MFRVFIRSIEDRFRCLNLRGENNKCKRDFVARYCRSGKDRRKVLILRVLVREYGDVDYIVGSMSDTCIVGCNEYMCIKF